jgi:hypothetical protein
MGQQIAGQPVAEAAGAFHSGGDRLAVLAGPGQQAGVAGVAGREAGRGQVSAEGVEGDGDVPVGMGVHPDNELGGAVRHLVLLARRGCGRARTGRTGHSWCGGATPLSGHDQRRVSGALRLTTADRSTPRHQAQS